MEDKLLISNIEKENNTKHVRKLQNFQYFQKLDILNYYIELS